MARQGGEASSWLRCRVRCPQRMLARDTALTEGACAEPPSTLLRRAKGQRTLQHFVIISAFVIRASSLAHASFAPSPTSVVCLRSGSTIQRFNGGEAIRVYSPAAP